MKLFALVLALCLGTWMTAAPGLGDWLYDGAHVIAIGKGSVQRNVVHWTDCSGNNPKDYKNPPYFIETGDCDPTNPTIFGLKAVKPYRPMAGRGGGTNASVPQIGFTVSDQQKFHIFFPAAKDGDRVTFHVTDGGIRLGYKDQVVSIKR